MTFPVRILLLATGGTIATAPAAEGGRQVRSGATDLLSDLRLGGGEVELDARDVCRLPSHQITPAIMCELARTIASA
ncbi:MAG: asparaginase domain-containing protein, partial [Candidatus Dormibacteraceae bacterium]